MAIISQVDDSAGIFYLESPISPRLSSTIDGQGGGKHFSVEVALLSRNVIFKTEDESFGGHNIIMYTASQNQFLEGVEIRGFGQTGNMGRYVS